MQYIEGNAKYYICGVPGNYAIKSAGNNRVVLRDIKTIEEARSMI